MFDFLRGRKKQSSDFNPRQEIQKLAELSPPSALIGLIKDKGSDEAEDMGRSFFLRRESKLYSEGDNLYLTTPDDLKKGLNLNNRNVVLQFMNRRIPYRLECTVVGRYRLLPEIVETLDFNAKAAFKLVPINSLKKQDKRQFYRYTLINYGDSRIPLTTHIGFDAFIRNTNQEFAEEGAPPVLLTDVELIDHLAAEETQEPFATRDAIDEFRTMMLKKEPLFRSVFVSKVEKDESGSAVKRKDEELLLGKINMLGLDMESLRDVLYLKKSAKAGIQKGKVNPYNLNPGEKIITNFVHERKYYQMLMEVMEARTQNEVVRPIESPCEEAGMAVELIDYSVGGALLESSPELLKFLLGDKCPPNVDEEMDFSGDYWQAALNDLQKPMFHLTFYPKLHFPDAVKRFEPELPFKIPIIAQVVRSHVSQVGDRNVLQHGLQFCYEAQGIPLHKDDPIDWRYSRYIRDNEHLKDAHSKLSQLYGYLENQSQTTEVATGGGNRQRRKEEDG